MKWVDGAMFDSELFGLSAGQFRHFAEAFLTPTLGFSFLFLLRLPLKSLPFVGAEIDYTPPAWVLPLFSIGSLFLASFFLSTSIALSVFTAGPSAQDTLLHLQRLGKLPKIEADDVFSQISMTVDDFDGQSSFRIFVNGYDVFGSSMNCMLRYQCTHSNSHPGLVTVDTLDKRDDSFHNIHQTFDLPFLIDISNYLVAGENNVDIDAENTGLGDCLVKVVLTFQPSDKHKVRSYTTEIRNSAGDSSSSADSDGNVDELFYAGGRHAKVGESPPARIDPYDTLSADGSYRLCERVHLPITLTDAQVSSLRKGHWREWAIERRRNANCETLNEC